MNCCFRKAKPGEAEIVYALIADRVRWMDENGIRQWNVTDYLNVFPLAYYQNNLNHIFVLVNADSGQMMCAALLFDRDERWTDDAPAYCIHNFVSRVDCPGAGAWFLRNAEKYALREGKRYLRLDSADDNRKLADYYAALGFKACGTCQDGAYHGILRQKELTAFIES